MVKSYFIAFILLMGAVTSYAQNNNTVAIGKLHKTRPSGKPRIPSSVSWNIYYDGGCLVVPGLLGEGQSASVTITDSCGAVTFLGEITGDDPTINFSPQPGVYTITLFIPCEGEFSGDILIV